MQNVSVFFGGSAGRERILFQKRGIGSMIDIVMIMSYESGYKHFDPVTAYHNYKNLVAPHTPVAIGIQPTHENDLDSAKMLVDDLGINNNCMGNTILEDQYGTKTPGTFSLQRFANIVKKHPGDGIMMWAFFALNPSLTACGNAKLATVTELAQGASHYLGIGNDKEKSLDDLTAMKYGTP